MRSWRGRRPWRVPGHSVSAPAPAAGPLNRALDVAQLGLYVRPAWRIRQGSSGLGRLSASVHGTDPMPEPSRRLLCGASDD
jgi:hypothetical protein